MDTINTIELHDETIYPSKAVLRSILGPSYDAYEVLLETFEHLHMERTWRYYKDGKAWLCKVQQKKRTIAWMSAWKGFMQVTVYVPARCLDQVYALRIQEETREKIRQARNVGKSMPCIFEIRDTGTIEDLVQVMALKSTCR